MTQQLAVFVNEEQGWSLESYTIDGEPWFDGHKAAKQLGYKKPHNALSRHVDPEDKNTTAFRSSTSGSLDPEDENNTTLLRGSIPGNPNRTLISEAGLYCLIWNSRLPGAKQFRRWVASEVLPAIRKTGSYGSPGISRNDLLALTAAVQQLVAVLRPVTPDAKTLPQQLELSTRQFAERAGVHSKNVQRACLLGILQARQLPNTHWRIPVGELKRYLDERFTLFPAWARRSS